VGSNTNREAKLYALAANPGLSISAQAQPIASSSTSWAAAPAGVLTPATIAPSPTAMTSMTCLAQDLAHPVFSTTTIPKIHTRNGLTFLLPIAQETCTGEMSTMFTTPDPAHSPSI